MKLKNLTKVALCAALMMGSQMTMSTAYAAAPDKGLLGYGPSGASLGACLLAAEMIFEECLAEGINSTRTCYHILLVNESKCY